MQISILACGWLGLPLGGHLVNKHYTVKGAVRQPNKLPELVALGIKPYLIDLNPTLADSQLDDFFESNILFINIPPKAHTLGKDFHIQQIESILHVTQNNEGIKIIFASSTSVYPDLNQICDENTATLPDHVLVQAEQLIKKQHQDATILRFGGLMGPERFPAKYSVNKLVPNPNHGVNYIHQKDAMAVVEHIITNKLWGKVYNVVSPGHPLRKDVFEKNCKDLGYKAPVFEENETLNFKIISSEKLLESGYNFVYDDPLGYGY